MVDREQVRRDLRSGLLTVEEIASRNGCSARTVYRIGAGEGAAVAGPFSGRAAATKTVPETKAEANKVLSAILKDFEDYYKEA